MDAGSINLSSTIANALKGLQKASGNLDQAAQSIAGGSLDPQDVVALSQAATNVKASAAVLKSADQASKSLLNITA
jgi:hypothetical protein